MTDASANTPHAEHPEEGATVRRVTWTGLFVNLFLSAGKFAAGILGHSQAVVADAVHSLSDSSTDIAVLIGSIYWTRPADEEHPYGHRRIETLVAVFVGAVLAATALALAWHALASLREPDDRPPGWVAFGAAVASILLKEVLYRWTCTVGRRVRSIALQANACHHRSDALSSVPTAVAVAGAILLPNLRMLDHVAAAIVSLFILQGAFRVMFPALRELLEAGAPHALRDEIGEVAHQVDGVKEVHKLRTRYLGARLQVDLHVLVDAGMTVERGHDIADQVTQRILESSHDVIDVIVHIEPYDRAAADAPVA